VPAVIWERSGDSYDDFPVPAAPFVNPIVVFLLGAICWFLVLKSRRLSLKR
jgi:hypothetical protein